MMTLVFLILGIGGLFALPAAWVSNCSFASADPPTRWRFVWRLRWPLGIVLALASVFMFYPVYGDDDLWYRVFGVPFPAFAFDERGRDYVLCICYPSMFMNFLMWLFFPHFPLWISSKVCRRRITPSTQI